MNISSILKNSVMHMVAKAVGLIIGLFTLALTARYLGQNGFGEYSTAFAWVQFAGMLVDLGLYMVLLSELGKTENKDEQEKAIGNILSLRVLSALAIFIIAIGIAWLMPYSSGIKIAISILALAFFCQSINQILTALFQYKQQMKTGALVEVIGKALALIFLLIIINKNLGLSWIVSTITLANIINTFIIWKLARKLFQLKFHFDILYWKKILPLAWPLAVAGIFNIFYFKADTLILSWFQPIADVGLYSAPYRLLEVVISLPPLILGLILPGLAKDWLEKDHAAISAHMQKTLHLFHMITLPMVIGTLLLAKPIMILIAGVEFAMSGQILQLLIIATAFIFYAQLFSYCIVATGSQKKILPHIAIASVIAVVLYFIFIPKFSYLAAATITIFVEGFIMLSFLRQVKMHIKFSFFTPGLFKIILSSVLMGVTVYISMALPVAVSVLLGIVVYAASLMLTRAFALVK